MVKWSVSQLPSFVLVTPVSSCQCYVVCVLYIYVIGSELFDGHKDMGDGAHHAASTAALFRQKGSVRQSDSHDDLMVIVVGLIAMELHQHVSE